MLGWATLDLDRLLPPLASQFELDGVLSGRERAGTAPGKPRLWSQRRYGTLT